MPADTANMANKKKRLDAKPSEALAEEIQRALEMMKRVRTATADQARSALEDQGNKYVLPEPLVFRVSTIS